VVPAEPPASEQTGVASWYGERHHGRRTASGETYDMQALTAAHRTLPFGTIVAVTSVRDGRTVEVRINDRGPHVGGRIIDLSYAAARAIGLIGSGLATVRLRVVNQEPDAERALAVTAPATAPAVAPVGAPVEPPATAPATTPGDSSPSSPRRP
jgi:rare lipoprotein A